MPSSFDQILDTCGIMARSGYRPYAGLDALGIMELRFRELNGLLDDLSSLPFADRIKVFGRSTMGTDFVPGDVDTFVEEATDSERTALLGLFSKRWGHLDTFVTNKGVLLCQCETSRPSDAAYYVRARQSRAILKAARGGMPVKDVTSRFEVPERLRISIEEMPEETRCFGR